MHPLVRAVLWLTFLESFGTVLLQRALYFLTSNTLHFRDIDKAFASHKTAEHLGERRAREHALRVANAGNDLLAMLVCVAPLMILCTLLGLRPLRILPRF